MESGDANAARGAGSQSSSAQQADRVALAPWAWRAEAWYRWLCRRGARTWRAIPLRAQALIWVGLLLIVAFITFAPVLPAGAFLNPAGEDRLFARAARTHGLRAASAYFHPHFFERECQRGIPRSQLTVYYRPLTYLSYGFEAVLWDCDMRFGRTIHLLLHVANAVLLGLLLLTVTNGSRPAAATVSLLYLATPTSAEAVSWWAARSDVLSTFFALGGLLAIVLWTQRGGWQYLVLGVLSLNCGTLSKETAAMAFPLASLWLVLAPRSSKSPPWQRAILIAGLLTLALGYLVFRIETHTLVRPPTAQTGTHLALGKFLRFVSMPFARVVSALELRSPGNLDLAGLATLLAGAIVLWPALRAALLFVAWKVLFYLPAMFYLFVAPRYRYAPLAGAAALVVLLCVEASRRWRPLWAPLALLPWAFAAALFGTDLFDLHREVLYWARILLSGVVRP